MAAGELQQKLRSGCDKPEWGKESHQPGTCDPAEQRDKPSAPKRDTEASDRIAKDCRQSGREGAAEPRVVLSEIAHIAMTPIGFDDPQDEQRPQRSGDCQNSGVPPPAREQEHEQAESRQKECLILLEQRQRCPADERTPASTAQREEESSKDGEAAHHLRVEIKCERRVERTSQQKRDC
jgi:hypothetical protein